MIKIMVLDRGWVVVGEVSKDKEDYIINRGAVIRTWGTTKGLPELQQGVTSKTILDHAAMEISFPQKSLIMSLNCNQKIWNEILK